MDLESDGNGGRARPGLLGPQCLDPAARSPRDPAPWECGPAERLAWEQIAFGATETRETQGHRNGSQASPKTQAVAGPWLAQFWERGLGQE